MQEIESEEHFAFRCPIYYAIRGRYHCLFRDGFGPLPHILQFPDQRCLAAFLHEITRHRDASLRARRHPQHIQREDTQRPITDFFQSQDTSPQSSQRRRREREPEPRHLRQRTDSHIRVCDLPSMLSACLTGVTVALALHHRATRRPRRPTSTKLRDVRGQSSIARFFFRPSI